MKKETDLIEARKIAQAVAISLGRDLVRNNQIGQLLRLRMRLRNTIKLGEGYDKDNDNVGDSTNGRTCRL